MNFLELFFVRQLYYFKLLKWASKFSKSYLQKDKYLTVTQAIYKLYIPYSSQRVLPPTQQNDDNCVNCGDSNANNYVNTGIAVTQYIVRLEDSGQMTGISTGDFVKLPGHSMGPNLTLGVTAGMIDETGGAITSANGLRVDKKLGSDRIVLTGFTTDSVSHGSNPVVGDYISIRRIFTIAKGRVGVI